MNASETMDKLNEIAQEYGWKVDNGGLFNRSRSLVHVIQIQKGRIRLLDSSGNLRGSMPVSNPNLGRYLEKAFYAQKVSQ